jgi:DNA-binding MarR family transcriptional regulator
MPRPRSQILDEIRQDKPLQSASQEALLGLFRTSDLLHRQIGRVLEPYGISSQQYNVLRILRGAGKDGLPTLEIADRLVEQAPGITRLLDRLEKKRWIRRKRCPEDRRQVLCWITPAGLALLGELEAPLREFDRQVLKMLNPDELATLVQLLDRIRKPA